MFDHAWKNAFGKDHHGRMHPGEADDTARHGGPHDSHPAALSQGNDFAAADDTTHPGGAPESHPVALGQDNVPAAADDTSPTGSATDSHALLPVQDNDTVIIGNGGSGGDGSDASDGSGGDGGVFNGDVTVDTGNDFNFFFGSEPVTDEGSAGLFSELSGVFKGLFGSLFAGGFQDNDTVIIGNGGNGGSGGDGSGGHGGVFNGDVTVDTGNEFHFFVGGEPVTEEGSSGFFAELSGMVSGLFTSLFAGGQDNDTVIVGNGGTGGDGHGGGDGGVFNGDVTVDTGNDFNFFFGSEPSAAEGSPGLFAELPGVVGGLFNSVFAGGFQDNDTVIIGNGGSGSGGDGGLFNGDMTVDAGNHFNFLLA